MQKYLNDEGFKMKCVNGIRDCDQYINYVC
jgi:hypothetical protein